MHSQRVETDDIELVQKARSGDMTAFEQLVHKHDRQVLSIAARYVTNSEDAKDIYQEVFIRVHRGLRHFKMQSSFATWLHRITVNVCLTQRSRRGKHVHVFLSDDGGENKSGTHFGELPRHDEATDQHAMNTEIRQHVQEALDELSPKQRLVFTLKHYDGYKLREIASMMQCTEGTVKRYLFLATRQLRTRLKAVYE